MIYKDRIYGKVGIKEPVLLDFLKSSPVLRLKKISQLGIPDKYYHRKNFSRYEHSVGVMILLKKLGATLEEQVAGLLHDASVLAFSHVADWVFAEGKESPEDYHDTIHEEFMRKTKIPEILERHDFILERILNSENFSLLEREIPDLCADRIDYSFREHNLWKEPRNLREYINSLVNFNGEIVFNDKKLASDFAIDFLGLQVNHWGTHETATRYHLFSEVLRFALKKKIISKKDFFKEEGIILNKLEKSSNKFIKNILNSLGDGSFKDSKAKIGKKIIKKFRHVDPKIIVDGELVRLSKIDSKFKKTLEKYREINKKGILV